MISGEGWGVMQCTRELSIRGFMLDTRVINARNSCRAQESIQCRVFMQGIRE